MTSPASTPREFGLLAFGEVLDTVPQDPVDLVERIILVASVAEGVLLNPASDLTDYLRDESDDVEGVDDRDGVQQLVTDRVGIAAERI